MRKTLDLDDDLIAPVREYAKRRKVSMGKAVSELVRRGLKSTLQTRLVNGIYVVDVPPDSPPVTSERIKELEAEGSEADGGSLVSNFT